MNRTTTMLVAAALCGMGMGTAHAETFKYSTWLPPIAPAHSHGALPLLEHMKATSDGAFDFTVFAGGQLFGAPATLGGIGSGAVDGGFTVPSNTRAQLKVNALFPDMLVMVTDPFAVAAAVNETILLECEECRTEYHDNNTVFLGGHASTPYTLICAKEISTKADLNGAKIAGLSGARWIETLGATPVALPPSNQLEALQRGVADCGYAPKEWLAGFALRDAARMVIDDPQGSVHGMGIMTMNLNSWNSMSDELKQSMFDYMPKALSDTMFAYYELENKVVAEVEAAGVKFISFGDEMASAFSEFQEAELPRIVASAVESGVPNAEAIVQLHLDNYRKWVELLDETGAREDPAAYEQLLREHIFDKIDLSAL